MNGTFSLFLMRIVKNFILQFFFIQSITAVWSGHNKEILDTGIDFSTFHKDRKLYYNVIQSMIKIISFYG